MNNTNTPTDKTKFIVPISLAAGLLIGGCTWAVTEATHEPVVKHHTSTVTDTTTTPVTKTKTKTKTSTVTHTPAPRTVTETQVARSAPERQEPTSKATNNPAPTQTRSVNNKASNASTDTGGIAACIAKYESGGNPKAENPSGASGLYQFMPGTWKSVTGLNPPASAYSVEVQTQAFHKLWAGGAGSSHWVTAHRCGY